MPRTPRPKAKKSIKRDSNPVPLAMRRTLLEAKDLLRGWMPLAAEITTLYRGQHPELFPARSRAPVRDLIERRKLLRLANGDPSLSVTLRELEYLDAFLSTRGAGLGQRPLFDRGDFLSAVAKSGRVHFLIGAKGHGMGEEERWELSHWDAAAMADLLSRINTLRPGTICGIHEILQKKMLRRDKDAVNARIQAALAPGVSAISIATPKANHASEVLLASMFEREAFVQPTTLDACAPFAFIWPTKSETTMKAPSSFSLPSRCLEDIAPEAARKLRDNEARAFYMGGKLAMCAERPLPGDATFGIVAAQWRGRDDVWLVLAGFTGLLTRALCTVASRLPEFPHRPNSKLPSRVMWVAVRGVVGERDRTEGEGMPTIASCEVIGHSPGLEGEFRDSRMTEAWWDEDLTRAMPGLAHLP